MIYFTRSNIVAKIKAILRSKLFIVQQVFKFLFRDLKTWSNLMLRNPSNKCRKKLRKFLKTAKQQQKIWICQIISVFPRLAVKIWQICALQWKSRWLQGIFCRFCQIAIFKIWREKKWNNLAPLPRLGVHCTSILFYLDIARLQHFQLKSEKPNLSAKTSLLVSKTSLFHMYHSFDGIAEYKSMLLFWNILK